VHISLAYGTGGARLWEALRLCVCVLPPVAAAAGERGSAIAAQLVAKHRAETGAYPETVGVMLWGLDAIKTREESVAIALALVGARPVKEGTGRVARFELVPLAELGRPRVDVPRQHERHL